MTDKWKKYIVRMEGASEGSGCIFTPTRDGNYSYILTARHVLANYDRANDTYSGDELRKMEIHVENNDKSISLKDFFLNKTNNSGNNELITGTNYFPHPNGDDVAILKTPKIDIDDSDLDIDDSKNWTAMKFIIAGFPKSTDRNGNNDTDYIYNQTANDRRSVVLKREYKYTDIDKFQGYSGGAVFKEVNNNFLLLGIMFEVFGEDGLKFCPIDIINEIISHYPEQLQAPILQKRKVVDFKIKRDAKPDRNLFINTLKESKLIFEDDNEFDCWKQIQASNQELFRISNSELLKNVKDKVIQSIGETLFKYLQNTNQESILKIEGARNENNKVNLTLRFTYPNESKDLLLIPWEYLRRPANPDQAAYYLADVALIVRKLGEKVNNVNPEIQSLKVLVLDYVSQIQEKKYHFLYHCLDALKERGNFIYNFGLNCKDADIILTRPEFPGTLTIVTSPVKDGKNRSSTPNIIHLIVNAEHLGKLGKTSVNLLKNILKPEGDGVYLIVVQVKSIIEDHYKQLNAFANNLLVENADKLKLPALVLIPHPFEDDNAEIGLFQQFYNCLANGETVRDSIKKLNETLFQNGFIPPPIVYFNSEDFKFTIQSDNKLSDKKDEAKDEPKPNPNPHFNPNSGTQPGLIQNDDPDPNNRKISGETVTGRK